MRKQIINKAFHVNSYYENSREVFMYKYIYIFITILLYVYTYPFENKCLLKRSTRKNNDLCFLLTVIYVNVYCVVE